MKKLTAYAVCGPDSYSPCLPDGFRGSPQSAWVAFVGKLDTKAIEDWQQIGYKVKSFTLSAIKGITNG